MIYHVVSAIVRSLKKLRIFNLIFLRNKSRKMGKDYNGDMLIKQEQISIN